MFKKLFLLFCGCLGLSVAAAQANAADLLGTELKLEKKSFDEVSIGTQDFAAPK